MATVLTIGTQSRIRTGDTVTVALPAGKTATDFRTTGATVRAFGTSYPVTPTLSGSEASFVWPAPQLRGGAVALLQLEAPVVSAGGGPGLSASATSYLASVSAGALIATMTDPYSGLGLGVTTYVAAAALPGQLALSGGTIVAGLTAPVAGASYEAKIRATSGDGRREVSETIGFTATAAPAPTPTPTPGVTALRPAFNRTKQTFVNTHFSDGVNTHGKYLSRHKVFGFDVQGGLQWYYANRCSEAAGFNSITVKARYQYPIGSAWVDCTFGGQPSVTITASGADVPIDVLAANIPAGAYIAIESYVQVASVGMKWPTLDNVSLASANGEGTLLGTTDLTGLATVPVNVDEFYGPVASRALTTAPRAYGCITDSIGNGATDSTTTDKIGFIQRNLSDTYPVLYLGTSSETAASWASTHSKRLALLDACGCTDAIIAMGTNDIASSATYTAVRNSLLQLVAYAGARRMGVAVCAILTRSVSGIPSTGFTVGGIADQVNTYMTTAPLVGKFVDTRPAFQTGANVIRAGLSDDNLHPNPTGHAAIADGQTVSSYTVASVPVAPVMPAFLAGAIDFNAESLRATTADGAAVGSWADGSGTVTVTEATLRPLFKANATPNGGASLVTTTAGNQRLSAAPSAATDNFFNSLAFYLMVYKPNSTGANNAGRAWGKGLDRSGMATAGTAFGIDYSTTDASIANTTSLGNWHVAVGRFNPGALPIRGAVDNFDIATGTPVAPVGSLVDNSAIPFILFNSAASDRAWDGEVARIILVKGLTADQEAGAQAYIRAAHGVPYN